MPYKHKGLELIEADISFYASPSAYNSHWVIV